MHFVVEMETTVTAASLCFVLSLLDAGMFYLLAGYGVCRFCFCNELRQRLTPSLVLSRYFEFTSVVYIRHYPV